mmetsp:Transcript_11099/g.27221  ORF Transcript_11099/g.27221 Transcript_11099/m.27221 type:complete len:327 (-) Transcript_11099:12-992(-)
MGRLLSPVLVLVLSASVAGGSHSFIAAASCPVRNRAAAHGRERTQSLRAPPSGALRLRGGQSESIVQALHQEDAAGGSEAAQKLIGDLEPLSSLAELYSQQHSNAAFLRKATALQSRYAGWRRVKGDGNCFIRGYIYAVLENLVRKGSADEVQGLIGRLTGYYMSIISEQGLGYQSGAIEDFHNSVLNLLKAIARKDMTHDMLLADINQPMISNSAVFFFRLVISCHLQQNAERFAPFMGIFESSPEETLREVRAYCQREVEPLEREVEQIEIIALTEALNVGLRIEHMDASQGEGNHHDFPEGADCEVFLLYRPGHYDVLTQAWA